MLLRTMTLAFFATSLALTSSCQRAEAPPTAQKTEKSTTAPAPQAEAQPRAESTQSAPKKDELTTTQEIAQKPDTPASTEVTPAPVQKPVTATTAAVEPAAEAAPNDAAPKKPAQKQVTKADILNSTEFRRAMFEFNEWLTSQPIYTPQQVAKIKDQFNHRVAEMNVEELAYLLADLEEKMQIINTPESREARAWMAQYLSVMSDKKRAQVLKDVPNVATMTAAQLATEIAKIQQTREEMDSDQAAFQRGQAQQVANQIQTDRRNQQNYVNDWNTGPVAYSPYRSQSNVNDRLNETQTGTGLGFYVSPLGGVGMTFSPSSW